MKIKELFEDVVDATDKFQQRRKQSVAYKKQELSPAQSKRGQLQERLDKLIFAFDRKFSRSELRDVLVGDKSTIFHLLSYSVFDPQPSTAHFVRLHRDEIRSALKEMESQVEKIEWSLSHQKERHGLEYLKKVKKEIIRIRQTLNTIK